MSNKKVSVDSAALCRIIHALLEGGVTIREIMATRKIPGEMGERNPINVLIKDYNAWVDEENCRKEGNEDESTTTAIP